MLYQVGPTDNCTHVPGQVAHFSSESEYIEACTTGMDLSHFIIIINSLTNKETYVAQEQSPEIILDSRQSLCMAKNGKSTKHSRNVSRRICLVRNGEK